MRTFDNDEAGYLQWVDTHPGGFVLNAYRHPGAMPDPYILHRASCNTIKTPKFTNYTTTSFAKICSESRQELVEWWANSHSNHLFRACKFCKP
jgi:hypothetical protein